jgi:hypothetical protein
MLNSAHISPPRPRLIDVHVHMVGSGSAGTGCWFRRRGITQYLIPFMLRELGLPGDALDRDFDTLYRTHLLKLIRASSLDAVVLLAQDNVYHADGTLWEGRGTFHVPNDLVLRLAREHPEFLPAVSIHPARPDALAELDRCVAGGAVAFKLLPNCHNIDTALPQYREFWRRLAESGLPFICHTGCESTVDETRPDLAHPHNLRAPLEAGVKVIAAHCATGQPVLGREWFHVWADMLKRYPNLYGDISALSVPGRDRWLTACRRPGIVERVLYGSDVPVLVQGWPAFVRGRITLAQFLMLRRERNPLERNYRLKRMMGFPDAVFTRAASLLRGSA